MIPADRTRRSAKQVISDMTNEILHRPTCPEQEAKLVLLETIASKMSWTDIFNRIRFRNRGTIQKAHWYQD